MSLLDLQGLEPPVDERYGGKGGPPKRSGASKQCEGGDHSSFSLALC